MNNYNTSEWVRGRTVTGTNLYISRRNLNYYLIPTNLLDRKVNGETYTTYDDNSEIVRTMQDTKKKCKKQVIIVL